MKRSLIILGSHDLGFRFCVWANTSQFIMIQIAFTCVYNTVDISKDYKNDGTPSLHRLS